jgi:hypothetical protein
MIGFPVPIPLSSFKLFGSLDNRRAKAFEIKTSVYLRDLCGGESEVLILVFIWDLLGEED